MAKRSLKATILGEPDAAPVPEVPVDTALVAKAEGLGGVHNERPDGHYFKERSAAEWDGPYAHINDAAAAYVEGAEAKGKR